MEMIYVAVGGVDGGMCMVYVYEWGGGVEWSGVEGVEGQMRHSVGNATERVTAALHSAVA